MEQQTAMQELIERLLAMEMDGRIQIYKSAEAQVMFDNDLKELLEKEKKQILNAQMDMFHFINNLPYGIDYLNKRDEGEKFTKQYYKKTYGSSKKV